MNKVLICCALLIGFDYNPLYVCLKKQIYAPRCFEGSTQAQTVVTG